MSRRVVNLRRGEISPTPVPLADPFPAASPRRLVGRVMGRTRSFMVPAAIGAAIHQTAEVMVPVIMGWAIDSAVVDGDPVKLVLWLAVLGVNFAVLSTAYRFGSWFGQFGAETMQHRIRSTVVARLLSPRAGVDRLPGTALSLATNDVRRITTALALLVYPVGELVAILVGGGFLLVQSLWLGLAVLIGVPLLLVLLDFAGRQLRRRAGEEAEALADAAGAAADLFEGHRVLRGIGATEEASRRYVAISQRALRATMAARRSEVALTAVLDSLTGVFLVGIALTAGLLAISGDLTVGQLITVVGLTQFLIDPVANIASNPAPIWSAALASARRVLDLLDTEQAVVAAVADGPTAPLTLRNAVVAGSPPLSLTVQAGEFVGIRSSAGVAEALAEVLAARRPVAAGEVWAGGFRITPDDPLTARRLVMVAPHEADLFDGTIADNLALVSSDDCLIARALAASAADEVLSVVPHGLRTVVGEAGLRLSGGQRQRIALARALAADPEVLVLHEPTTAVDSVTEARIAEGLRQLRQGRTTVLVTSSPALLAVADRVIAFDSDGGE